MKATGISQAQEAQTIIAALDHASFTRRHTVFVVALLTALVFDYAKPFTISFVIPGVRELFGLTAVEGSYLAVAGLTGTVVGSFFWGFMADRIGRRVTLLWTISIFTVSTLCGFTLEYWQTLLACFVMGFGVGAKPLSSLRSPPSTSPSERERDCCYYSALWVRPSDTRWRPLSPRPLTSCSPTRSPGGSCGSLSLLLQR